MATKIIPLFLVLLISSCASISLEKTYKLEIKSDKISKIQYQDSIYSLPTKIEIYRSTKPLKFTYIADSINHNFEFNAIHNPNFVYGNLFVGGYHIDLLNPKRFYYGKTNIDYRFKRFCKSYKTKLF